MFISVACPGPGCMRIFDFFGLHTDTFVGLIILEVNGSLVCSRIVVSILKFSLANGGTFCVRTKLGEAEESAVESVSDVNANAARWISLIMAARYRQKIVRANTQLCLRPLAIGNGLERSP